MGMCYEYEGSASYPRFDEEVCAVAAVFGGIKTEELKKRQESMRKDTFDYWFGFYISDNEHEQRFAFPEDANEVVAKWLNNIYEPRTAAETKEIWDQVREHHEIKEISIQIWGELRERYLRDEGWEICQ